MAVASKKSFKKINKKNQYNKKMKVRSVKLLDAYGRDVKVVQKKEVTRSLGGEHEILRFKVPAGYLRPRNIVYMKGLEPVYTDTFVMMNPWKVEAPGIDGYEDACKLNLREAANIVFLGGKKLYSWIEWGVPLEMRSDRGWFRVRDGAELLDMILRSGAMVEVPGTLHKPHDKEFKLIKSFKTVKNAPVFQVTLWHHANGEWVAELDMDLKRGMGHWVEVVRNHLTHGKTHPYIVNQLLAWYWGVVSFKLEIPVVAKSG